MGITGSSIISAIDIQVLNLDGNAIGENTRDLVLTLKHAQELSELSTAVESSLSPTTTEVDRLFSDHCSKIESECSSGHDDEDDSRSSTDDESTPSTSRNYLHEWTPQYSSSLSIFATLSSGNFLSEKEVIEVFSRYGNIKEVKWIQISDNNGYLIVFSNEIEKESAIEICGNKMETKGRILKLWSFKQAQVLVNNKLTVATKSISQQSIKDKDNNDPCVIGETKLIEFNSTFRIDSNNDDIGKNQIPWHPITSTMTLNENMPSPERPGTRPSPTTAFLLKQISQANMPETGQFHEKISCDTGSQKNRFLNLPAPYHLLPDTPYFRRAPIVPPPTRSLSTTEQIPIQQRIINRYLASMKMDDENGFAAIARYERECYERLYGTSSDGYPLTISSEQQRNGYFGTKYFEKVIGKEEFVTGSGGKHILSTDSIVHSTMEDQTKICNNVENSTDSEWSTQSNGYYEIWNCAPLWRWNFTFKD